MTAGRGYRWWVVAMLWLVCLFNYADRQAITSVFEPIKKEMTLTDQQLGIIGGAFMWVYAAAAPLAGLIGDRLNRKFLILAGLAFWSFVTVATAWAQGYWQLVSFRALEGLAEAFYFPASMSLISDYHGPDTRSRAMGLHQSSVYVGTIVGSAAAGYLAEWFGWRSGFYLFGTLGMVLAVVLVATLREPVREVSKTGRPPRSGGWRDLIHALVELLRTPMVWVLMAVFVGANFVAAIFLAWTPTYLNRRFGLSLGSSGLNATLWLQLASVAGVISGGWLADRWAARSHSGRMSVQALGLFAGAPLIALLGWADSLPAAILALTGLGFCKGHYDANLWAGLYDVVRPERRATAVGLMNAVGWFGGGTAAVTFAVASDHWGMGNAMSSAGLIYVVAGILLVAGRAAFMDRAPTATPLTPIDAKETVP
jgi:predicted MFS family arabinose efflux permease